jgi:serine/threonine-protein kinase RsbW
LVGNIAECLAKGLEAYSGDRDTLAFHLNLVLTEAAGNAIRHGSPANEERLLHICIEIRDDDLCIRVFDYGQGFDLDHLAPLDSGELEEGGRGILVMRALMDSVAYKKTEEGNVLEMRKKLA